MDRVIPTVRARDEGLHRLGILGAEIEYVPHLDAAGGEALGLRHGAVGGLVVLLVRGGVERGPGVDDGLQRGGIVEIRVLRRRRETEIVLVAEDLALAGVGEDDEFVAEVAADRAGVRLHRDRLQAKPLEGAQVGDEHPVVRVARAGLVEVEGIGVLHQEFARAHGPEARAHLVAELPLDVVEVQRQRLVGAYVGPEDLGDHLLVRRPEQHVALVPVLDAQHFGAIGVVAAALPPEVGGLDRRHQDLDGAGAVLLLPDDGADAIEYALAQRQPRENPRRLLAHQAGAQHQAMGNDLGLAGRFFQGRQKVAAQTHLVLGTVTRRTARGPSRPRLRACRTQYVCGAKDKARARPGLAFPRVSEIRRSRDGCCADAHMRKTQAHHAQRRDKAVTTRYNALHQDTLSRRVRRVRPKSGRKHGKSSRSGTAPGRGSKKPAKISANRDVSQSKAKALLFSFRTTVRERAPFRNGGFNRNV